MTIPPDRYFQSPMDRALADVERCTGVPRDRWESVIGHPYARAALKRAKQLAGICDQTQLTKLACRQAGGRA